MTGKQKWLVATLIAVVAACIAVALSACKAEQVMTPAEIAAYDAKEAEIKAAAAARKETETQAAAALKAQGDALAANNAQALAEATSKFASLFADWKKQSAELAEKMAESDKMVGDASARATAPLAPLAGAAGMPGWLIALIGAAPLAARFAFPRSREHLIAGLKDLAKANVGDFALDLGKSLGLKHSADDVVAALEQAREHAVADGNAVLVKEIDDAIAQATAAQAMPEAA